MWFGRVCAQSRCHVPCALLMSSLHPIPCFPVQPITPSLPLMEGNPSAVMSQNSSRSSTPKTIKRRGRKDRGKKSKEILLTVTPFSTHFFRPTGISTTPTTPWIKKRTTNHRHLQNGCSRRVRGEKGIEEDRHVAGLGLFQAATAPTTDAHSRKENKGSTKTRGKTLVTIQRKCKRREDRNSVI